MFPQDSGYCLPGSYTPPQLTKVLSDPPWSLRRAARGFVSATLDVYSWSPGSQENFISSPQSASSARPTLCPCIPALRQPHTTAKAAKEGSTFLIPHLPRICWPSSPQLWSTVPGLPKPASPQSQPLSSFSGVGRTSNMRRHERAAAPTLTKPLGQPQSSNLLT